MKEFLAAYFFYSPQSADFRRHKGILNIARVKELQRLNLEQTPSSNSCIFFCVRLRPLRAKKDWIYD